MMCSTSWPKKQISGRNLPSQQEARKALEGFKRVIAPPPPGRVRGMLKHWADVGLVIDGSVDFAEYVRACEDAWQKIPAVLIDWVADEWLRKSKFFPKPAEVLEMTAPYLAKWREVYSDLDKLAHWEREEPFKKEGTPEERRAQVRDVLANLRKDRQDNPLDDVAKAPEENKGQTHG